MEIDWDSPDIQRAVVQGGLTALGVIVGALASIGIWFLNRRKDRADARKLREERREDLMKALWSDILPVWMGLYLLGDEDLKRRRINDAFDAARTGHDATFTPFVVPAAEPLFARRLADEVSVLESREIEPVVRVYHQLARLNQMIATLRDPAFAALSLDRKEAGMLSVLRLELQAEVEARTALRALERALGLPDEVRMDAQIRRANVERARD